MEVYAIRKLLQLNFGTFSFHCEFSMPYHQSCGTGLFLGISYRYEPLTGSLFSRTYGKTEGNVEYRT
ncbi:Hypothetical predicted protein [Octopus vulgaris]|uniref:Uncharacterized protein n=1 Tax=Octopus vulgaris TaxID=6645 RepID=A0AA36F069_OCTVU|nr:Hypothetical predicted protein [Octopus vulgaris]